MVTKVVYKSTNQRPLVSVIIPVYNIEEYLTECIESVLQQTYLNIEIILVNDGSLDGCRAICDYYQNLDKRILVIHQENSGLSEARNSGTRKSTGDFIFYLDGDDWLKENCIEELVTHQVIHQAEVVQGNFYYSYDDYYLLDVRGRVTNCDLIQLNTYDAMKLLLDNIEIKNFAWGKLIDAKIAKSELFPKGKLFEDTFWTHNIIAKTKKYIVLKEPLLFYRQRSTSISYQKFNKRNLDRLEGLLKRRDFILINFPELKEKISMQYLTATTDLYFNAKSAGEHDLAKEIKSSFTDVYEDVKLMDIAKVKFATFKICPAFYKLYKFLLRSLKFITRKINTQKDFVRLSR